MPGIMPVGPFPGAASLTTIGAIRTASGCGVEAEVVQLVGADISPILSALPIPADTSAALSRARPEPTGGPLAPVDAAAAPVAACAGAQASD